MKLSETSFSSSLIIIGSRQLNFFLLTTQLLTETMNSCVWYKSVCVPASCSLFSSEIRSSALTFFAASRTWSAVQSVRPYSMLYLREPENSSMLWDTKAIWEHTLVSAQYWGGVVDVVGTNRLDPVSHRCKLAEELGVSLALPC